MIVRKAPTSGRSRKYLTNPKAAFRSVYDVRRECAQSRPFETLDTRPGTCRSITSAGSATAHRKMRLTTDVWQLPPV
jgi:hypothetical protein